MGHFVLHGIRQVKRVSVVNYDDDDVGFVVLLVAAAVVDDPTGVDVVFVVVAATACHRLLSDERVAQLVSSLAGGHKACGYKSLRPQECSES